MSGETYNEPMYFVAKEELVAEQALADDLADMLQRAMNPALRDEPQVVAVLARYREARQ
jgi:hypothetical protein